jgi:hypothetical protein
MKSVRNILTKHKAVQLVKDHVSFKVARLSKMDMQRVFEVRMHIRRLIYRSLEGLPYEEHKPRP